MWKVEANDQFLPQLLRFTYMYECFACVYIYVLFVCLVLMEVRYSGIGVTEVCESQRVLGTNQVLCRSKCSWPLNHLPSSYLTV